MALGHFAGKHFAADHFGSLRLNGPIAHPSHGRLPPSSVAEELLRAKRLERLALDQDMIWRLEFQQYLLADLEARPHFADQAQQINDKILAGDGYAEGLFDALMANKVSPDNLGALPNPYIADYASAVASLDNALSAFRGTLH